MHRLCLLVAILGSATVSSLSPLVDVVNARGRELWIPEQLQTRLQPYGRYNYIDRDPERLGVVLDWIRDGSLPRSQADLFMLDADADFFDLPELKTAVGKRLITTARFVHFLTETFSEHVVTQDCGVLALYHFLALTAPPRSKDTSLGCREIYAVNDQGHIVSADGHAYVHTPGDVCYGNNRSSSPLYILQYEVAAVASRWTCFPDMGPDYPPPVQFAGDRGHSPPTTMAIPIGNSALFSIAVTFCLGQGGIPNKDVVATLVYESFFVLGSHPSFRELKCQAEMGRMGIPTPNERLDTIGRLVFSGIHGGSEWP